MNDIDVSGYLLDPVLRFDYKRMRMGSKRCPETYISYNITPRHKPKALYRQFHRGESLGSQITLVGVTRCLVLLPVIERQKPKLLNSGIFNITKRNPVSW